MSVAHSCVSFNHSCLKVPVDPTSKKPSPNYERIFNCKLSGNGRKGEYRKSRETSAISSTNSSVDNNYKSVESYLQFYETIPDYRELHHLSDEEFYSRLKSLKITQKRFCSGTSEDERIFEAGDRPSSHSSIGFRSKYNPEMIYGKRNLPKKSGERFRSSSGYSNSSSGGGQMTNGYLKKKNRWFSKKLSGSKTAPKIRLASDSENVSELGPERKNIRVECPCKGRACDRKSCLGDISDKDPYGDECFVSDDGFSRKSKSVPNSPGWKPKMWRYACKCCWDALLRDDSDSLHPLCVHGEGMKRNSPKKQKKFYTRPVPLLSRIPLYEKIMAEQEERRRVNHNRYSRELQALVQPFSFTKREEEEKQKLRMTCSNPELNASQKRSQAAFKAKPIPKNLFSNYAYERMREEDFYRELKKRIRAEEMLKSSSLPPSMAAREKKYRSKSLDFLDRDDRSKPRGHKRACEALGSELELEEKRSMGKNPKRRGKPFWLSRKVSNSVTDSSAEVSPYESVSEPERRHQKRPHSAISINRSNLASVLRMQTVRKRMEKEMADNLEESRMKQQAKFKERLIRMTPAWRALNYSTEEDLALRVAARREEERLKRRRYEKLMGSIYGRVHKMPPLFQRQASNLKQTKSCDDVETNPKYFEKKKQQEKTDDVGGGDRRQAKTFTLPSTPSRFRSYFRTHKSSESSGSHEKSECSKIDESDNETGSHEDEIDDYIPQQGDDLGRINDRAQKGTERPLYQKCLSLPEEPI